MVIRDPNPDLQYDPMAKAVGRLRAFSREATAEVVLDQLKRGKAGRWEVICDEPTSLGGLDTAPAPLDYLGLAILF